MVTLLDKILYQFLRDVKFWLPLACVSRYACIMAGKTPHPNVVPSIPVGKFLKIETFG